VGQSHQTLETLGWRNTQRGSHTPAAPPGVGCSSACSSRAALWWPRPRLRPPATPEEAPTQQPADHQEKKRSKIQMYESRVGRGTTDQRPTTDYNDGFHGLIIIEGTEIIPKQMKL